ncbi:hypothetical protein [Desulfatirhabdium butyrativorans]|nr:hypothetical protein [Desulfatirhabdium butyrativorans]
MAGVTSPWSFDYDNDNDNDENDYPRHARGGIFTTNAPLSQKGRSHE